MRPKIKILLELYELQYGALVDVECLIAGLKRLPGDMRLESRLVQISKGIPPMKIEMTVSQRLEGLERDKKILDVRLESYKEQLDAIPGGKKALKDWEDGKLEPKTQSSVQEEK